MELFVYGTLTDPERVASVLGDVGYELGGEVVLEGLHRVDCEYPTLAPGGDVTGRVLDVEEVSRVDRYEGVDRELYARVPVPRADGGRLETYVGDPEKLGCGDRVEWPGTGELETRVRAYLRSEDVLVR